MTLPLALAFRGRDSAFGRDLSCACTGCVTLCLRLLLSSRTFTALKATAPIRGYKRLATLLHVLCFSGRGSFNDYLLARRARLLRRIILVDEVVVRFRARIQGLAPLMLRTTSQVLHRVSDYVERGVVLGCKAGLSTTGLAL